MTKNTTSPPETEKDSPKATPAASSSSSSPTVFGPRGQKIPIGRLNEQEKDKEAKTKSMRPDKDLGGPRTPPYK